MHDKHVRTCMPSIHEQKHTFFCFNRSQSIAQKQVAKMESQIHHIVKIPDYTTDILVKCRCVRKSVWENGTLSTVVDKIIHNVWLQILLTLHWISLSFINACLQFNCICNEMLIWIPYMCTCAYVFIPLSVNIDVKINNVFPLANIHVQCAYCPQKNTIKH